MVKIYVEGGGDTHTLRTACRRGFSGFLEKAGLKGYMPRIVACGSRNNAYADFCTAMTLPALKGGVSSLDRKLLILRGFIPRQLCGGKKFALKGGV
ncbi:MAG: hypothetical protein LBF78_13230, partial [Treponema sp.]|nr:hypothetical protein [Treponema sp.]